MPAPEDYSSLLPVFEIITPCFDDISDVLPSADQTDLLVKLRPHRILWPHLLKATTFADAETIIDANLQSLARIAGDPIAHPADAWYANDVLGEEPKENFSVVKQGLLSFLIKYIDLHNDDPVLLFTKKDAVCHACVVGGHCKDDQEDNRSMGEYIKIASRMGRQSGSDYIPVFSNGKIVRIKTNKRTVAEVVSNRIEYISSPPQCY